jgi:hypothetical protein
MRACVVLLLSVVFAVGCGESHEQHGEAVHEEHAAHVHKAQHGGTLVAFGDEFANLELVLDPKEGLLTAYAFGPHAEKPIRLSALTIEIDVTLGGEEVRLSLDAVGSPLTGETPGDTSEFVVADDRLRGVTEFEGVVRDVELRGRRFDAVPFRFPAAAD